MTDVKGYAFVGDDDVVVRASEAAALVNEVGLRTAAARYGTAHSNLWRFLKKAGYEPSSTWARRPASAEEAAE